MSRYVNIRWLTAGLLFMLTLVACLVGQPSKQAAAQTTTGCPNTTVVGRLMCDGYFTGVRKTTPPTPADAVFYDGIRAEGTRNWVTNVDQYVQIMKDYLYDNDGSINPVYGSDAASVAMHDSDSLRNNVGAANHIDIMLGKNGPDFGGNRAVGIQYARDNFTQWESLVRSYDSRGLIEFGVAALSLDQAGGRVKHTTSNLAAGDNYFFSSPFYVTQTIRFNLPNNGGVAFQIEEDCGNIFGFNSGLQPPTTPPPGTPPPGTPPPTTPPPGTPPPTNPPLGPGVPTGDINKPTGSPPGFNTSDSKLYSSCQVISGHAFDPRTPTEGVKVTITFSNGSPPSTTTASVSGAHLFTLNTPDSVRSSLSPVTLTAKGTDSAGVDFALTNSPITIGPCVVIAGSCVNAATIPAIPDPNSSYSVKATVQYATAADAAIAIAQPDFKFFLRITGPNGPTVVYNNANVPGATRNGNQISVQVDNLPPTGKTGIYLIGWGVTGSRGAITCGSSIPGNPSPPFFSVGNKPYFKVNGGDISVGAAMTPAIGSSCSISKNEKASIVGWNANPLGNNYRGAGAQYAAFALNHLQEFATSQTSTAVPREPSGLAFANNGLPPADVNNSAGLYGGKLGGSSCVPNYFANATPLNTTVGRAKLSSLPGFPAGGTIPNNVRYTYYVDGDLLIDTDVKFSGDYTAVKDIPTFTVIVKGNIYVRPGVRQLDGFYIAEASTANASNGIIYTCAPSDFNSNAINLLRGTLQDACKTPLTVNGSFIARQIWLLRTDGTVSTTPAETFNYVPELWLTSPFSGGIGVGTDYDAITSLPPVL